MEQPQTPINAGQRLLTNVVDEVAQFNPQQKLGVIPSDLEVSQGFRDVPFGELAHAVNALSWWIEEQVGKAKNNETVAYMGRNDIVYLIFILACNKTGYKVRIPKVVTSWYTLTVVRNSLCSLQADFPTKPINISWV